MNTWHFSIPNSTITSGLPGAEPKPFPASPLLQETLHERPACVDSVVDLLQMAGRLLGAADAGSDDARGGEFFSGFWSVPSFLRAPQRAGTDPSTLL